MQFTQPKIVKASDLIKLRSQVLRPNQSVDSAIFLGDDWPSTIHLAFFDLDQCVSCGTFIKDICAEWPTAISPYRLRGMATAENYRGKSLGTKILVEGEARLREIGCDLLWFNARENAFEFYQKNGFTLMGELFDIPGTGPHKIMYKWLIN